MHRVGIILGILAVLALLGTLSLLPPPIAFFVCALAIILFPGFAVTELIGGPGSSGRTGSARGPALRQLTPPERLVLWFVIGTGLIALIGFAGHLFQLRLSHIVTILVSTYALLIVLMLWRSRPGRTDLSDETLPTATDPPDTTWGEAVPAGRPGAGIYIGLATLAIGSSLVTLLTRRDYDDWYYLSYIRDYVVNKPLGVEDGIFGMGAPAAPRVWFGGGWWVMEALLSKASGIDPIVCHQIYLPLLLLPFAVLACFMLSRHLFRSHGAALAACSLQFLFFLSNAFPFKAAGWAVFSRIAQDKMASCFIFVPVALALGFRLIRAVTEYGGDADTQRGDTAIPDQGGTAIPGREYLIYCSAIAASLLVHGLGPVWCGLFIVPFALIEWVNSRRSVGSRKTMPTGSLVLLLLPIAVAGSLLLMGHGAAMAVIVAPTPAPVPLLEKIPGIYLPGYEFRQLTETVHTSAWIWREWFKILHPLFITRYPLAMLGFVLSFVLLLWRRSPAARFLMGGVFLILFLLFTPVGAALAAAAMTWSVFFRLVWPLPWGLVIAFPLTRSKVRPVVTWLVILGIALALGRGDPRNYVSTLRRQSRRNRPLAEMVDVFRYIGTRPSPQGVVLAPELVGRMIGGFLPDAYPVNFREYGPVDREKLKELMDKESIDRMLKEELDRNRVSYILLEHTQPLAKTLSEADTGFELMYENDVYAVWRVAP